MRAWGIAFALLAASTGCCLSTSNDDAGQSPGNSGSSSGGSSGTTGGGTTGGINLKEDAGTCLIDGGRVPAGAWLDPVKGSCIVCDPTANPTDWTELDAGTPCQAFIWPGFNDHSTDSLSYTGVCWNTGGIFACHCTPFGNNCGGPAGPGCCGGVCSGGDFCTITQNIGWIGTCWPESTRNPCAQGPCCADAGVYQGTMMGWCCGLDSGHSACLGGGNVCYDSSNCCPGLTCLPATATFDSASYGVCG
jgi:hypothetical protein